MTELICQTQKTTDVEQVRSGCGFGLGNADDSLYNPTVVSLWAGNSIAMCFIVKYRDFKSIFIDRERKIVCNQMAALAAVLIQCQPLWLLPKQDSHLYRWCTLPGKRSPLSLLWLLQLFPGAARATKAKCEMYVTWAINHHVTMTIAVSQSCRHAQIRHASLLKVIRPRFHSYLASRWHFIDVDNITDNFRVYTYESLKHANKLSMLGCTMIMPQNGCSIVKSLWPLWTVQTLANIVASKSCYSATVFFSAAVYTRFFPPTSRAISRTWTWDTPQLFTVSTEPEVRY